MGNELKELIEACDLAIKQRDFDTLMTYYTDDAILVVKPGMVARGKEEIKTAFINISKYFNDTLVPTQGDMMILEAGDTALVISQTFLDADLLETDYSMDRRATYVFTRNSLGKWLCAIDNSYGTEIISQ